MVIAKQCDAGGRYLVRGNLYKTDAGVTLPDEHCYTATLKEIRAAVTWGLVALQALKDTPPAILALEERLGKKLGRRLDDILSGILREMQRTGRIPSAAHEVAANHRKLMDLGRELGEMLADELDTLATHVASDVREGLAAQGVRVDFKKPSERVMQALRDHVFRASEGTMRRISGDVMGRIEDVYRRGLSIPEAAEELKGVFDGISTGRAKTIARTEIVSQAQNKASHELIKELGMEFEQWITAEDERVRGTDPEDEADHVSLHGQIVRVNDHFEDAMGIRYLHPGDPSAPLHSIVNCRCKLRGFIIPEGYMPPPKEQFYEDDLLRVENG